MKVAFLFLAALAVGLLLFGLRKAVSPYPYERQEGGTPLILGAIAGGLALLMPLSDWLWG